MAFILSLFTSCYNPNLYEFAPKQINNDTLDLSTLYDSIPADSFSTFNISAFIPLKTDSGKQLITFQTNRSTFIQSNSSIVNILASLAQSSNPNMMASMATLISINKIDTAIITITVAGITKYSKIFFYNAFPDSIRAIPSAFEIDSSFKNQITITGVISKTHGKPTMGNYVSFKAFDSTLMNPIGYFINTQHLSDINGNTSTLFSVGDSTYKGYLYITATSFNGIKQISDTTKIYTY